MASAIFSASGAVMRTTVWAAYMPEEFMGMGMTTPWIYSALYNGAYMLPDLAMLLVVFVVLYKTPAAPYFKKVTL